MRRMDKSLNDCGVSASSMRVCVCVRHISLYLKKRPMYTQKRLIYLKKRPISSAWMRVCVCVRYISLYLKKRHMYFVIAQKETYRPQRDLPPPHGRACVCVLDKYLHTSKRDIYIFMPQKETYTPPRDPSPPHGCVCVCVCVCGWVCSIYILYLKKRHTPQKETHMCHAYGNVMSAEWMRCTHTSMRRYVCYNLWSSWHIRRHSNSMGHVNTTNKPRITAVHTCIHEKVCVFVIFRSLMEFVTHSTTLKLHGSSQYHEQNYPIHCHSSRICHELHELSKPHEHTVQCLRICVTNSHAYYSRLLCHELYESSTYHRHT